MTNRHNRRVIALSGRGTVPGTLDLTFLVNGKTVARATLHLETYWKAYYGLH